MGSKTETVTTSAEVLAITVDPNTKRVYVEGVLRVSGYPDPAEHFPLTDVTDLLNATQKAAANTLAQGAQAYMDGKLL